MKEQKTISANFVAPAPSPYWAQRDSPVEVIDQYPSVYLALNCPTVPTVILEPGSRESGVRRCLTCSTLCCVEGSVRFVYLSCPLPADVDVIAKFAQLEFQLGDAERAKAIFENTLSTYPKRTDVWSVYIDMTIKHGSQKEVR